MTPDTLDAAQALAREADLLAQVSETPDMRCLWLWDCPRALVVPRKLALLQGFDEAARASVEAGWPVTQRITGGDVTPQGPGIVNVTHAYSVPARGFDMGREYDRLCTPIERALGPGASRGWKPGAFCDGAHNVQIDGLKFAGTAMRFRPARGDRGRMAVMAHALMLMRPPEPAAIAALNALLAALGEPRRIDRAAHGGLPGTGAVPDFLARLVRAFDDAGV
jgi:lipoate-protein ligase A